MRIELKPGHELKTKGTFRAPDRDKTLIDEWNDKMHQEGQMSWGTGGSAGWSVFVIWDNRCPSAKPKGRVDVDIRGLNVATVSDSYPLPLQDAIMACLKDKRNITMLDLTKSFFQRRVAREDRWKTAIVTHRG